MTKFGLGDPYHVSSKSIASLENLGDTSRAEPCSSAFAGKRRMVSDCRLVQTTEKV